LELLFMVPKSASTSLEGEASLDRPRADLGMHMQLTWHGKIE